MSAESVAAAWLALTDALAERWPEALDALRPSESEERIRAAEAATAVTWPEDLRALYRLQGGCLEYDFSAEIWPGGFSPHTLDLLVEQHQRSLEIWKDADRRRDASDLAGEPAITFLPSYLPVALDGSGTFLIVDARPGPASGCVVRFDRVDADLHGPDWPSIPDMLRDAAAAIRGEPHRTGYVFGASDPYGRWGFVG